MSSAKLSDGWRSSSSRLLGLYSLLFVAWSCVLLGVLYWRVSLYLDELAQSAVLQRAHLFEHFSGDALAEALRENRRYDLHGIDAYGLFTPHGEPLAGVLKTLPKQLPIDGSAHPVSGLPITDVNAQGKRGFGLAMPTRDGRILVLVRYSGPLNEVNHLILDALLWGVSLTLVPGLLGWHLLRRRPLRRIQAIEQATAQIVAGNLGQRLPLSNRRDELDMLAAIVNAMLDRIEQLMTEVKGVCDNIAHDLRTPLTRLRAQLYRMRQQVGDGEPQALALEQVLDETDTLMARFRALLRISELEDHQRRSGFVALAPDALLQEIHAFYAPLAEEKGQWLALELAADLPVVVGDRGLLFEAIGNLLDNAIRFAPEGGRVLLAAREQDGATCIAVEDSGPGIPEAERSLVFQRFHRAEASEGGGFGLGLSIVAAIAGLHGFRLGVGQSLLGGAGFSLLCRPQVL
ncbi:TPA: HAMP domain-containing protein [Stenotrophomonas maltophilia]|nr:HAMP domain-containing protein [Stenotrophomonas maltophilia]HDS1027929.1 HAMP domain-containing protein [Stenotrophomonas maltophilia]HDS1032324.1 HAMP domain-containing protein [Stenotrophomonas maltophilia]HDS1036658.1 HAMP domain-containing protein [Stenotrophomonas maltophilia]